MSLVLHWCRLLLLGETMDRMYLSLILLLVTYSCHVCHGDLESDIDALVNAGMRARGIPGLALTVIKDGAVALTKGYGVRDIDSGDPATADTLFGIASCSKSFATSLLVKLLRDNPSYKISTNIYKILGSDNTKFNNTLRSTYATLEDLMTHSLGIPRNNFMRLDTALTRDNLMERLKYLPSSGGFRRSFYYNDLMYGLLAHITEVLGGPGKTWEELVRSNLFQPLSMCNSTFLTQVDFSDPQVATPYYVSSSNTAYREDVNFIRHYAGLGASGAVMTTANDMAKYLLFHLSGGKNLLGQQVVETDDLEATYDPVVALASSSIQKIMSRPQTPVTMSEDSYGLGWKSGFYRGYRILQHTGSTYGYKAIMTLLPHKSSAVFTAFNGNDDGYHFRASLHSAILDQLLGETPWLNSTTIATFPAPWSNSPSGKRHTDNLPVFQLADDEESDEIYFMGVRDEDRPQYREDPIHKRDISDVSGVPLSEFAGTYKHGAYGNVTIAHGAVSGDLLMHYGIGHWRLTYTGTGYVFDGDWLGPSPTFDVQVEFLVNGDVYGVKCLDCDSTYVPAFYRQG